MASPSQSATPQQAKESAASIGIESATPSADVAVETGRKPAEDLACCGVADESREALLAEGEVCTFTGLASSARIADPNSVAGSAWLEGTTQAT
jgi:hypothetical protein